MQIKVEFRKLEYLLCFVGTAGIKVPKIIRLIGIVTWFGSLLLHFAYDIYAAVGRYGFTFLASEVMWFFSLLATTWGTSYRVLPWLLEGWKELEKDSCYEKTMEKLAKLFRKTPYVVIIFGFAATGIQHAMLHVDGALHVDFGQNSTHHVINGLEVLRFAAGFHVYAACVLFWIMPTSIMLMTGYSMSEFMDEMSEKMKDKDRALTFKEAISSYSERAKFVKTSSSKTFIVLTTLVIIGVLCFGLNAYVFLFGKRHYLHVWHSLLPVILMIYPLCIAAWVTKQYTWFIIIVVRAWVHRSDLDESSDDDSGIDDEENEKLSPTSSIPPTDRKKNFWGSTKLPELKNNSSLCDADETLDVIEDGSNEKQKSDVAKRRFGAAVQAITAANRFRNIGRRPRFNFEKFLSYLESMRPTVGFHIAGVMVTWDLVSTTLFLLFSVVAVFMQESIFGSQKSTI